jgi:hypothetical protein
MGMVERSAGDVVIIDCHTHLSKFGHEGQTFAQVRDDLLADMQLLGIDTAFVYPDSDLGTGVSGLETTRTLVSDSPGLRMLGTACIDAAYAACIERLDFLAAEESIIGVKLYPGFETFYPCEEKCSPVYELCLRHNLPVVFHSGESMNEQWREKYNHPREIAKVAERFPELKVVIAHFSQPHLADCRDVVLAYPSVHVDISGLAYPDVVKSCGQETISEILEDVAGRQPEKILFGTDWPICDVQAHLSLVESLHISDSAKGLILAGNAVRVFGLPEAQ